jgi:hypothetical protein
MNRRPSGAMAIAVGPERPPIDVDEKPLGGAAASAGGAKTSPARRATASAIRMIGAA